jgi:hypothetical protein
MIDEICPYTTNNLTRRNIAPIISNEKNYFGYYIGT